MDVRLRRARLDGTSMRECRLFTKPYRGVPITAFWIRPELPGKLIYGYHLQDGDFEVWGTGFLNTALACRAAAQVIDSLFAPRAKASNP